jgi:DNA-binding Lrp family transcriptional regulator
MRKLEEDKIITAYTARPSIFALNSIPIVVFGSSDARSMNEMCEQLGNHENIFSVAIASGKFLYISAVLRNISELQDFSTFISRTAEMDNPSIGIVNVPYPKIPMTLTDLDYQILKSLNRDARKTVVEITEEINYSAKTIKKHLDNLISNNLASFSIEWAALYTDSFVTVFHLELPSGADINSTIAQLYQKYERNIIIAASFSNLPNLIIFEVWTQTPRDSHDIQEELYDQGFKDVTPHIFMSISWYECWLDQILVSNQRTN